MDKLLIINLNTTNKLDYNSITIDSRKDFAKLKKIKEKYVIFYNNNSEYRNVDFDKIISFMNDNNLMLYALNPCYLANKKIEYINFNDKSGFIEEKDEIFNFNLDSYIINSKLLKDLELTDNFEEDILLHILSKAKRYFQSKDELLIKETKIIKDVAKYPNYNNKEWYLSYISNTLLKNIKRTDSHYVKNIIYNLYLLRLFTNYQQSTICILNDKEYEEFINISKELLNYIDNDILDYTNFNKNVLIHENILDYVLRIRNNDLKYEVSGKYLVSNSIKYLDIENTRIIVNTINSKNNKLYVDCTIDGMIQKYDSIEIIVDGNKRDYKHTNIYSDYKIFGKNYYKDETIQFELDLDNDKKVIFKTKSGIRLKLRFSGIHSKLTEKYSFSYWNVNKKFIRYRNNILTINNRNFFTTFINELKYWTNIIKRDGLSKSKHAIVLRTLYYLTLPKYKNRDIWITYDKIFKSGDCGEYLYRYAVKKHEIYYILSKKAKFYNKLKEETGNVLPYGERKTKLIVLHSKKIFASDSVTAYFCGFSGDLATYCKGLFNYEVNCIQHGLTMQDIAFRQNRLFDNIQKYFIASKYERENLLKSEYGYTNDQIIDSGIPRFDGLHDKSEKMILLAPTWRVNVASNISNDRVRARNSSFKDTNYFKVFNGFINNKKLLKLLKEKGYKIVFLIHPTLVSNKDDYDSNEYVDIISSADVNYEDMLTSAKIMITDYSGVQYDFAYMKKPIIYYHTPLLPPSYNDGVMNYKTMGFGNIVSNEDELVSEIEKLLDNDGKIDKKFEKRIDSFFLFNDFKSSERIYNESIK